MKVHEIQFTIPSYPPDKDIFVCSYSEWQEKRTSTTFWSDFCIADKFGVKAVKDTFRRAFAGWKDNYKYLTELTGVLNHKLWNIMKLKEKSLLMCIATAIMKLKSMEETI